MIWALTENPLPATYPGHKDASVDFPGLRFRFSFQRVCRPILPFARRHRIVIGGKLCRALCIRQSHCHKQNQDVPSQR